ncbi:MAG: hypothetical protein JWR34_4795 [Mycobacterium sp.]|nr:hypothetical protein [Mycobacterium sp.]
MFWRWWSQAGRHRRMAMGEMAEAMPRRPIGMNMYPRHLRKHPIAGLTASPRALRP